MVFNLALAFQHVKHYTTFKFTMFTGKVHINDQFSIWKWKCSEGRELTNLSDFATICVILGIPSLSLVIYQHI